MPKVVYTGDSTALVRAEEDFQKAQAGTEERFKRLAKEANATGRETKRFLKTAETSQDRYNRKLHDANRLVKAGKISQADATRVLARYRQKLEETGHSLDDTRETGLRAFGKEVGIAGAIGVATAAGGVLVAKLREIEERAQSATDNFNASLAAAGKLSQISNTPGEFQGRQALVDKLTATGVVAPENRAQAGEIAFALSGATKTNTDLIIELGKQRVVAPSELANTASSVNTVIEAVGGKEAGSTRDVLNKAIATAQELPTATFTDVASAVAELGPQLDQLKFRDEAGFAAASVLGRQFKSIDKAKDRANAFLRKIDAKGLAKGSLLETVDSIQAKVDSGARIQDIIGEDETAIAGFRGLRNKRDLLASEITRIDRSQQLDPLAGKLKLIESDPRLNSARVKAITAGRLSVEEQKEERQTVEKENLLDSIRSDFNASFERRGDNVGRFLTDLIHGISDAAGNEDRVIRDSDGSSALSTETQEQINDYLRRSAEASERTAVAAEQTAATVGVQPGVNGRRE